MTKEQHTPGPWKVGKHRDGRVGCTNNYHVIAAQEEGIEVFMSMYLYEPDARLIAAAPELLEILIDILDSTARTETMGEVCQKDDFSQARAVIAKATGASCAA